MARPARRPGVLSPSALIRRNAIYKGFLGGNRGWLVLGGTFWAARFLRKSLGRSEVIAATEILRPGQTITIRTITPTTRRQRRAGRSDA